MEIRSDSTEKRRGEAEYFSRTAPSGVSALLWLVSAILLVASISLLITGFMHWGLPLLILANALTIYLIARVIRANKKMHKSLNDMVIITDFQRDIIRNFSHKIREPLNDIAIIGNLLSGSGSKLNQKDLIDSLVASTNNMVTTINELPMQSAATPFTEKRRQIMFNLNSTVRNTIELFQMKGHEGLTVRFLPESPEELNIIGDPILLKQIVIDLLNTAAKKQNGERRTITMKAEAVYDGDAMVPVTISVSGPKGALADLGERRSPTLALRLITQSSGSHNYSKERGKSVFSFTLHFKEASDRSDRSGTGSSTRIVELRRDNMPKRKSLKETDILLVEDNEINRKITLLTLKPLVKRIDTAVNGREALDMMATSNYDVVLMDIQMPVMNGLVATEKIRSLENSIHSGVPIIAITANAMLGDRERCIAAGMDAYISKPFQPAQLIDTIKRFL